MECRVHYVVQSALWSPSVRVILSLGRLQHSWLEVDREPRGVVGACQVVAAVGLLLVGADHPAELLNRQDLTLVRDCMYRVLVCVRGLEQSALKQLEIL